MSHHFRAFTVFCFFWAVLSVLRVYITGTTEYLGFVWNLILALPPYFFAWFFIERRGFVRWISFVLWLLFFPNSLYIFTDFIHLPEHPDMLHFDIVYISTMAMAGLISGFASLEIIHTYWNKHFHKRVAWILVAGIVLISVFGVYIGRFLRFNSWNIVTHPLDFLREVWIMMLSDGWSLAISDGIRALESVKYSGGIMSLSFFVFLYSVFFLILYVFIYHTKKTK